MWPQKKSWNETDKTVSPSGVSNLKNVAIFMAKRKKTGTSFILIIKVPKKDIYALFFLFRGSDCIKEYN